VFRSVARRNPPIAEGQSVRSRVYEGVTIALSILVAFGIDAAWGEWNETREEQRILTSLLGVPSDWMPLLEELSYLPQINNAWQNLPGTMTDYATRLPTRTPTDHRRLLNDQRLENALVRRLWAQDDILFRYEEIRPRIESMIELLRQETGR
jgi:hypothetical protein